MEQIIHYRYYISLNKMEAYAIDIKKETNKCYFGTHRMFKKSEDDIPALKDRTSYPYVDFYSTKDSSMEYAILKICKFFADVMKEDNG